MPRNFSCAWRNGIVLLILIIGLLVAWNPSLMAQTAGTGALTGTVTDSSGAVVPGATVTATSADTGQARTATTGADGAYTIGILPPGNYRVKFEAAGFKAVEISSATVTVTETAVLDRTLEVGAKENRHRRQRSGDDPNGQFGAGHGLHGPNGYGASAQHAQLY